MSAPKHTPGPWTFGSREGWRVDAPTHYSSHYTLVAKGRRAPIAFVVSTARDEDEYHANARLIAAAPDLLEAAERALIEMEALCGNASLGEIGLLRSAIAKATEEAGQ
jgi:hypothetical protein